MEALGIFFILYFVYAVGFADIYWTQAVPLNTRVWFIIIFVVMAALSEADGKKKE